jgi:hypothetical protein
MKIIFILTLLLPVTAFSASQSAEILQPGDFKEVGGQLFVCGNPSANNQTVLTEEIINPVEGADAKRKFESESLGYAKSLCTNNGWTYALSAEITNANCPPDPTRSAGSGVSRCAGKLKATCVGRRSSGNKSHSAGSAR